MQRVNVADKRVVLPPKETAYGSIEGLMNHFMLVMDGYGIRPPAGEVYFAVEGANGELGFYVVSDGTDRPVPRALPAAVPAAGGGAAPDDRGRDGRRHRPDLRLRQHDRRGARPVSDCPTPPRRSRSRPSSSRRCGGSRALYPDQRGALLPVLHMAQETFGYISLEVEEYVAGLFELSPAHVHEVVTFYTLYLPAAEGPPRGGGVPQPVLLPARARRASSRTSRSGSASSRARPPPTAGHALTVECLCACEAAPMCRWTIATRDPHAGEGRPHPRGAPLMAELVLSANFDGRDAHTPCASTGRAGGYKALGEGAGDGAGRHHRGGEEGQPPRAGRRGLPHRLEVGLHPQGLHRPRTTSWSTPTRASRAPSRTATSSSATRTR